MAKFDYVRAQSIAEAVDLLGEAGLSSRPLAGGTDILVYIRQQAPWFDRLVDISQIKELKIIEQQDDEIIVGGGVTFTQAAQSQLLQEAAPLLVEACQSVGSVQIRNLGTLDVPEIKGFLVEQPLSSGPYGAKNIAEPAMVATAPAILNAIANATGRRIRDLPANLERVLLGRKLHPKASVSLCKLGLKTV